MRKGTFTTTYFEEHTIFWVLVCCVVFLIGLYLYFVSASIINVIIREEAILASATTHSRISELEVEYVSKKDKITSELAQSLGFIVIREKHFVERTVFGRVTLGD